MPRQARLDAAGILHHVMIRGIERRKIFRNDEDRNDLIERLARLLPETKTACYAWALIPNHAHFLLRSGPSGIASLMRRLLTGYVVSFNRRHRRAGQLFQNRYKSIICQEDPYFKELVRYIHLNPLRAGLVTTVRELDRFPYAGHSALTGNKDRPWQDTTYVLHSFSDGSGKAKKAYRSFVQAGIDQGRRDDLTGGGLVRSLGGWSEVRRRARRIKGDQRILGDSNFVMRVLAEANEQYEHTLLLKSRGYTLTTVADRIAGLYHMNRDDLLSKGRQALRVEARSLLCYLAVRDLKRSVTDLARVLGMTPSAISYAVARGKRIADEKRLRLEELLNN
jgi:putative transposase